MTGKVAVNANIRPRVVISRGIGALGGAVTNIPEGGVPFAEAYLRADHVLVTAHGASSHAERVRNLLTKTAHSRLDRDEVGRIAVDDAT